MKRFALYALRWQMSTPILAFVIWYIGPGLLATVIANFIGAIIFYWIDRYIFHKRSV